MEKTIKKRVALLTICPLNIGAILQSFALKEYVISNYPSITVDLLKMKPGVDYESNVIKKMAGNFVIDIIIRFITLLKYREIKRGFDMREEFKEKHFSFVPRESMSAFINDVPSYDIYLTGSDQVFNNNNKERCDVYYQKFPKNGAKKFAYAPSFGFGEYNDAFISEIREAVLDFDALSCREKSGAELLSQITGRNILKVLDPTLLLTSDDWNRVSIKPKQKNDYIFIYDLNGGEALIEIATKISCQTGLEIICFTQKPQKFYRGINKQIYDVGPAEFLGWISEAKYVVTDSFHGTIFAVNYNKPFSTYIAFEKVAQRITSFLTEIDLNNRIVYDKNKFIFSTELLSLKYDKNNLSRLREVSENYLDSLFER